MKIKSFSDKQAKVMTWWTNETISKKYNAVIADGSIRSGKTMSMSLSFVLWAMTNFDGCNFAICGKTVGSCRRNVIKSLLEMIRKRYAIQDKRSENLIVIANGEIVKDGKKEDVLDGLLTAKTCAALIDKM